MGPSGKKGVGKGDGEGLAECACIKFQVEGPREPPLYKVGTLPPERRGGTGDFERKNLSPREKEATGEGWKMLELTVNSGYASE